MADRRVQVPADPRTSGLRREQLLLLCRQAGRSPYVTAVVASGIVFLAWGSSPPWLVLGWFTLLLAAVLARKVYSGRVLAAPPVDPDGALGVMLAFTFFNGILIGAVMLIFFRPLGAEMRAALTIIILGLAAGGLSTNGAYARGFTFFASPVLLSVAVAWSIQGGTEGAVLALLTLAYAAILILFARDSERLVRESFFIRHERDQLVAQLDRERQQVTLARDNAQQANRAKSRFLASASHDLRQPLHALSLFSAALAIRAKDSEVREISGNIGRALGALSALVDALLDVSRLDAGAVKPELQSVNAGTVAERVVAEYRPAAERKGLALTLVTCEAPAHTDPLLLDRILRNLVDNAVKYTVRGGVAVQMRTDDSMLRIAVADTGEGIPEAERERVFEEFYQIGNPERDRSKGLGLGLAIVRRVGRLLGTEVELQSEVGRGSTFAVLLPLSKAAVAAGPAPAAAPAPSGWLEGRGVLVIDDEPDVRVGMRTLLETWGCRVAVCSGLQEAEDLLKEHELKIDLIVADFRLRAEENGIDTVKALQRRLGPVPALLVTGDTAPERLQEAEASGLPLLHKPVSAEAFRSAMLASMAP